MSDEQPRWRERALELAIESQRVPLQTAELVARAKSFVTFLEGHEENDVVQNLRSAQTSRLA